MPYTFAHPGFALPLKKLKTNVFCTTGLIFGSITPDYDIILRFSNQRLHIFQYNMRDIFLIILPIAFVSSIYFHLVIRNVLIDYAPTYLRNSLLKYKDYNYLNYLKKNSIKVILSIVLAILLHLFFDLISHLNAYPFKVIGESYFQSKTVGFIFYYMAIYLPPILFSIAGFYLIFKIIKETSSLQQLLKLILEEKKSRYFVLSFMLITIIVSFVKLAISGIDGQFVIDSFVISLTNGLIISFFFTPTIFAILKKINNHSG
ncbi:MAG: DUF4184 family protein [Chitinophagales bacterium]